MKPGGRMSVPRKSNENALVLQWEKYCPLITPMMMMIMLVTEELEIGISGSRVCPIWRLWLYKMDLTVTLPLFHILQDIGNNSLSWATRINCHRSLPPRSIFTSPYIYFSLSLFLFLFFLHQSSYDQVLCPFSSRYMTEESQLAFSHYPHRFSLLYHLQSCFFRWLYWAGMGVNIGNSWQVWYGWPVWLEGR